MSASLRATVEDYHSPSSDSESEVGPTDCPSNSTNATTEIIESDTDSDGSSSESCVGELSGEEEEGNEYPGRSQILDLLPPSLRPNNQNSIAEEEEEKESADERPARERKPSVNRSSSNGRHSTLFSTLEQQRPTLHTTRPSSPSSRPQSYYWPRPSFPSRASHTSSRPSSVISAGSIDSGFFEQEYDALSRRRNSIISRPPLAQRYYTAHYPTPYNPYNPPPAPLPSTVQHERDLRRLSWRRSLPNPISLSKHQTTSIPMPFGLQSDAPVSSLLYPSLEEKELADERPARERKTSVDYFNQSDQKKCLKVFQDADIEKSGAVSMFEIQAINTDLMPFQPKTIDRLVRLFADDDPTRVRYPSLNFDQFFAMWTCIREWKLDFEWGNWDKDVSVSRSHLLLVLKSRYHLDSKVLDTMYKAFHLDERLHLEDFVNICISLKRITDNFKHWNEGVSRNASRSIEQYSADVLLFHYEMSLGEAVYKRPAAIEKSEIVEDPGSASVTGNTPSLAPLPTVLEVNSSAEATPQLKNLIQQTNSGASETQVLGHSISSEQDLSLKNWKSFLPRLPDEFRDQLELREVFGSGLVWTCTPSDNIRTESIPLTIAGRPVVIPVEYLYPLMPATPPPPDPHPRFIDPSIAIDEATVNDIFNTFQDALGFYILINGMLQLIVSDGFDFQYAVSHRPNNFGGLKVSYISQDMIPTAAMPAESSNSTVTVQPASPVQSHQHARTMASSSTNFSQRTNQDDNLTKLELGSLIQAKVEKSKATERFQGKIGVMTISNDGYFLVVSSHVLTQALTAAKHDAFPGTDWVNKVTIISGNGGKEIGRVSETFDPQARAFPHGFLHDVSLVDVTYAPMHLVSGIKSPLPTEWLSQAGWSNIKYTTQTLYLLDSPNIQSKSIGILGSQCQMVGQGIFRLHSQLEKKTRFKFSFGNKRFNSTSASSTPETWTSLVSRSMLYRVDPDYRSPGAQSGTAVCVHEESEDKVEVVKIAGFSSYAQQVSDVQRFDMEGKKFYNRLEEGRVAFYGALQTPEKLREEHTIAS